MNDQTLLYAKNRRIFPVLLFIGIALYAAFALGAWFRPEVFSWDGYRTPFSTMTYLLWSFRSHFLAMGLGLLLCIAFIWRFRAFFNRHFHPAFAILVGGAMLLLLGFNFIQYYQKDELEHIHTIWKMLGGAQPFTDFFQHHHPLLWYQGMPVVAALGASVKTLLALRAMQFLVFLGIMLMTYRIALLLTRSWEVGALALLLLASFRFFSATALEFRPDVEQVFFCLAGYYFFLKYLEDGRQLRLMAGSGLCFALGFLYLQKALFFLFPLGLAFLYLLAVKKMTWNALLVFTGAFLAPVLFFFGYYVLTGQWTEYLFFNWAINFYKSPVSHSWNHYTFMILWNPVLLILVLLGTGYMIRYWKRLNLSMKITLFVGAALFLIAFLNPRAWKQYYLPAFPLLAIPAAWLLKDCLQALAPFKRLILCGVLAASALPVFLLDIYFSESNENLYAMIREQRRDVTRYAFDEDIRCNLFQRDMHFFWYSTHRGRMYDGYRQTLKNPRFAAMLDKRYDDFDFCKLVDRFKPVVVFQRPDSEHQLKNCPGTAAKYEDTGYFIFKRIDPE